MENYESPTLTTYGSVEALTGVIGSAGGTDIFMINGNTLAQTDETKDPDLSCIYEGSGSFGSLNKTGGGATEAQCKDFFNTELNP